MTNSSIDIFICHAAAEASITVFFKNYLVKNIDELDSSSITASFELKQHQFDFMVLENAGIALFLCSPYSLAKEEVHLAAGAIDAVNLTVEKKTKPSKQNPHIISANHAERRLDQLDTLSNFSDLYVKIVPICHSGTVPADLPVYLSSNQGITLRSENLIPERPEKELNSEEKRTLRDEADYFRRFAQLLVEDISRLLKDRRELASMSNIEHQAKENGNGTNSSSQLKKDAKQQIDSDFYNEWKALWLSDTGTLKTTDEEESDVREFYDNHRAEKPKIPTSYNSHFIERRLTEGVLTIKSFDVPLDTPDAKGTDLLGIRDSYTAPPEYQSLFSISSTSDAGYIKDRAKQSGLHHSAVERWEKQVRMINGITRPMLMKNAPKTVVSNMIFGQIPFLYDGSHFYVGLRKTKEFVEPDVNNSFRATEPSKTKPTKYVPWFTARAANSVSLPGQADVDVSATAYMPYTRQSKYEFLRYIVDRMSSMGLQVWFAKDENSSWNTVEPYLLLVNESDIAPHLEVCKLFVIDISNFCRTNEDAEINQNSETLPYSPEYLGIKEIYPNGCSLYSCLCSSKLNTPNQGNFLKLDDTTAAMLPGDFLFAKDGKVKYRFFKDPHSAETEPYSAPESVHTPTRTLQNITENALVCDHYLLAEYGCCRSFTPFTTDEESGEAVTKELYSVTARTLLTCF